MGACCVRRCSRAASAARQTSMLPVRPAVPASAPPLAQPRATAAAMAKCSAPKAGSAWQRSSACSWAAVSWDRQARRKSCGQARGAEGCVSTRCSTAAGGSSQQGRLSDIPTEGRAASPAQYAWLPRWRTHQQRGKHVRLGVGPRLLPLHGLSCRQHRPCRPALRQVAASQVEGSRAGRAATALGWRLLGGFWRRRRLVHLTGGGGSHEEGQLQVWGTCVGAGCTRGACEVGSSRQHTAVHQSHVLLFGHAIGD